MSTKGLAGWGLGLLRGWESSKGGGGGSTEGGDRVFVYISKHWSQELC